MVIWRLPRNRTGVPPMVEFRDRAVVGFLLLLRVWGWGANVVRYTADAGRKRYGACNLDHSEQKADQFDEGR